MIKKEYDIVYEPITTSDILNENGGIVKKGVFKEKWNIYYYENNQLVDKQFYSYDGIESEHEIKKGYISKE